MTFSRKSRGLFVGAAFVLIAACSNAWAKGTDEERVAAFNECIKASDMVCAENVIKSGKSWGKEDALNWILRAQLAQFLRNDQDALKAYSEALKLDPEDYDARVLRAMLYMDVKDYDKGIEDFKLLQKRNPENMNLNLNTGAAMVMAGRFRDALPYLEKVVEKNPDHVMARINLIAAYDALPDKSAEAYDQREWVATNAPEKYREFASRPFSKG